MPERNIKRIKVSLVAIVVLSAAALMRFKIDPNADVPMPWGIRDIYERQTIHAFIYFLNEKLVHLLLSISLYQAILIIGKVWREIYWTKRLCLFICLICLGKLFDEFTNPWMPISLSEKLWIGSAACIAYFKILQHLFTKLWIILRKP